MANKDKKDLDIRYNWKVYLSFLKNYKPKIILLLFLVFLVEVSYVVTKFLFKVIVDQGTNYTNDIITRGEFTNILLIVAGVYLVLQIFRAILKFVNVHLLIMISANTMADLKRRFFNHIIHLSHGFHTSHKTGSLISRLIRGSNAIDRMNDVIIFNVAPLLIQVVVIGGSLLYFSVPSAIVLFILAFSFIFYSIYIHNISKQYGTIRNDKEDIEKANISDVMTNIDSIKYFGRENFIKSRFRRLSEITKRASIKFWSYFRILDGGQSLILGIGLFFLLLFPLIGFLNKEISLGSIVFIYTVYGNIVGTLFSFVHGVRDYYRAMIDFEALFSYGKIHNDILDMPNAKLLKISKGEIEFRDVSFKYNKRNIFRNFNLKIKKNQKIALVGHSGSGKTTLIKLLYRLYDPQRGEILVDGKDIRNFKQESLRSELSIVPQEAVLFDDTIYNNVAFSNPNATRTQVMNAMKFAQLDKIVKSFPDREKTIVGERGVKLSGGEKQRVSIARAILADKNILVLDEATSALDSQTEYEIQKDLKELMKGRTSIIIAHRLSTIMHADKIIVMERGKIVQIGKHDDLIKKPGQYKKLWNLQKGGYIK